ncbi:hypothetical protein BASA62_003180 [Batrachochytrium salamandrivorans]|nr:hypothetical protein BASA62_003180 [Batrachochytrium salamandrivorans]
MFVQPPSAQILLPSLLPVLRVANVQARALDVAWTYASQDPRYLYPGLRYQLSKVDTDALNYRAVYEGEEPLCYVADLKPMTEYTFKLRIAFTNALAVGGEEIWSKDYSEVKVTTTDEHHIQKATMQLIRAIVQADTGRITKLLSEYGKQISMEARDKQGKTLLMIACQSNAFDIVRMLLVRGASTTATTQSGKSALTIAVTFNSLKSAEAILQQDPDQANVADAGGSTPLMWASENATINKQSGVHMVELLLRYSKNVNQEDFHGQTALDRLCSTSGNVKAAQYLILAGARIIHQVDKKHPMTSLMTAALNGHNELVKELIEECRSDPTIQSAHGATAKDFAQTSGHHTIVNLIEKRVHILSETRV